MKHAYFIDLRRYAEDLFGSSAKQTTTVQVQIQLKTGAGSKTLKDQAFDWGTVNAQNANRDEALFQYFSFMSYLETLSFMDLKGGIYSHA